MNTSQDESDGGPRHVELVEVGVAERVDDAQVDVADGLHGAQLRLHELDAELYEAVDHRDGICAYRANQRLRNQDIRLGNQGVRVSVFDLKSCVFLAICAQIW